MSAQGNDQIGIVSFISLNVDFDRPYSVRLACNQRVIHICRFAIEIPILDGVVRRAGDHQHELLAKVEASDRAGVSDELLHELLSLQVVNLHGEEVSGGEQKGVVEFDIGGPRVELKVSKIVPLVVLVLVVYKQIGKACLHLGATLLFESPKFNNMSRLKFKNKN